MEKLLGFLNIGNVTASLGSVTGPKQLFGMLGLLFVFLYGMSVGKTRALLSLLSIYVAFALVNMFPYFTQISEAVPLNFEPYITRAIFFFALYIAVFAILHMSSLKRMSLGELSIGKVFIISVIQIGFIAAVIASFIPSPTDLKVLGPLYPVVGMPLSLFAWSVGSLAILPFIKHRKA